MSAVGVAFGLGAIGVVVGLRAWWRSPKAWSLAVAAAIASAVLVAVYAVAHQWTGAFIFAAMAAGYLHVGRLSHRLRSGLDIS